MLLSYIDKLDTTFNIYNNKYHRKIKMKHIKVKTVTYIDFDIESNDKNFKFQVCDSLKISTYKNIFAKF